MPRFLLALTVLLASLAAYALTVTGKVLGPEQQPLPHARLHLIIGDYDDAYRHMFTHDRREELDLASGEDGVFAFTVNQALIRNGIYAVGMAVAPGCAPTGVTLYADHTTVALSPAGKITGSVLDPFGKPLPGVRVRLAEVIARDTPMVQTHIPAAWDDLFTARTDEHGRWTIAQTQLGVMNMVVLDDPRYVSDPARVVRFEDADKPPTPLIARPAGVLTGRVLTPTGTPAAGIEVHVTLVKDRMTYHIADVRTDTDGSYRITSLRRGGYSLSFIDPSQRYAASSERQATVTEGKEQRAPDTTLLAAGMLEGTVRDSVSGIPLPNVSLCYMEDRQQSTKVVTTGTDGRYRLALPTGNYTLFFSRPAVGYVLPPPMTRQQVAVVSGETQIVDFRLEKGMNISGSITDEPGNPLPGIAVCLREICDDNNTNIRAIAVADAQGRFTVNGFTPGKVLIERIDFYTKDDVRLKATDRWDIVSPSSQTVHPDQEALQIVLRRAATRRVSGRVVTPQGMPVAGVEVTLCMEGAIAEGILIRNDSYTRVLTDTTGSFIADVRTDRKATLVSIAKAGWMPISLGDVEKKGTGAHVEDSLMAPLTGQIRGSVKDAAGQPVANAIVVPLELGSGSRVYSYASGQFTVENLPEGAVSVLAITQDGAGLWQGQTGANDLTITLKPQRPTPPRDIATVEARWLKLTRLVRPRSVRRSLTSSPPKSLDFQPHSPSAWRWRRSIPAWVRIASRWRKTP